MLGKALWPLVTLASVAVLSTTNGVFFQPNTLSDFAPLGAGGVKVVVDPANIFEWTSEGVSTSATIPGPGVDVPIVIDVNGNGTSDQMEEGRSLLITDFSSFVSESAPRIALMSSHPNGGERLLWQSTAGGTRAQIFPTPGESANAATFSYSPNTPTVVRQGASLFLRVSATQTGGLARESFRFRGRLVNH